jgi:hypothetical protein
MGALIPIPLAVEPPPRALAMAPQGRFIQFVRRLIQ